MSAGISRTRPPAAATASRSTPEPAGPLASWPMRSTKHSPLPGRDRCQQRRGAFPCRGLAEQAAGLADDHERAAAEHRRRSRAGPRSRPAAGSGACRCRRVRLARFVVERRTPGLERSAVVGRPRSGPGRARPGRCPRRPHPRCRRPGSRTRLLGRAASLPRPRAPRRCGAPRLPMSRRATSTGDTPARAQISASRSAGPLRG